MSTTSPTDPKGEAGSKKAQLQLIPPVLNTETARAFASGAAKYGVWNWRSNKVEMMTYLGAMRRHIDALLDGEDLDPESGAHHLGHVAAGCAIVLDAKKAGTLVDNRPKVRVRCDGCQGRGVVGGMTVEGGETHPCPFCSREPAAP